MGTIFLQQPSQPFDKYPFLVTVTNLDDSRFPESLVILDVLTVVFTNFIHPPRCRRLFIKAIDCRRLLVVAIPLDDTCRLTVMHVFEGFSDPVALPLIPVRASMQLSVGESGHSWIIFSLVHAHTMRYTVEPLTSYCPEMLLSESHYLMFVLLESLLFVEPYCRKVWYIKTWKVRPFKLLCFRFFLGLRLTLGTTLVIINWLLNLIKSIKKFLMVL